MASLVARFGKVGEFFITAFDQGELLSAGPVFDLDLALECCRLSRMRFLVGKFNWSTDSGIAAAGFLVMG